MRCPYCGKEMVEGFIQSQKIVFFTEELYKMHAWPFEGELILTRRNPLSPAGKAFHCPDCKIVIVDYSDESREFFGRKL
jgi:predicted RNA-binding Zn-ribbon protein involved in translation (DUF1610 family)